MLTLAASLRVYLASAPVDMRKSFDGLSAAVETVFGRNLLDGHQPADQQLQLDATQLALLLSGVQLDAPKRKRYVLPQMKAG